MLQDPQGLLFATIIGFVSVSFSCKGHPFMMEACRRHACCGRVDTYVLQVDHDDEIYPQQLQPIEEMVEPCARLHWRINHGHQS